MSADSPRSLTTTAEHLRFDHRIFVEDIGPDFYAETRESCDSYPQERLGQVLAVCMLHIICIPQLSLSCVLHKDPFPDDDVVWGKCSVDISSLHRVILFRDSIYHRPSIPSRSARLPREVLLNLPALI